MPYNPEYMTVATKTITFRGYYESFNGTLTEIRLKQAEFRAKICNACHVGESTVYSWLRGNEPSQLAKEKIAEILSLPVAELWPAPKPKK